MDSILLFSHGSVVDGAGQALDWHAAQLAVRRAAAIVDRGYLNYSEPRLPDALEALIQAGATRIAITPYFLVPGQFVVEAVPRAVDACRRRHPDVQFALADCLGADPLLATAVEESALAAVKAHGRARKEKAALLVLAHGSPLESANRELEPLARQVRQCGSFASVELGFLECAEPSIPDAIDQAVARGASTVVMAPFFLHAGRHVSLDLPAFAAEARARHPAVTLLEAQYIGRSPVVTDLLQARARSALERLEAQDLNRARTVGLHG